MDTNRSGRVNFIDALRGLAILLSLNQHLGVWFFKPENGREMDAFPFLYYGNAVGGFAGPLFLTLAGISAVLFLEKHRKSSVSLFFRGMILMGFGYLLNLCAPCWFTPASWFTLHMIGFGMVISPCFRNVAFPFLLLVAFLSLVLTVILQNSLDTPMRLWSARMGRADLPGGVFRLILVEGHFPLFPWLSFFLGGMAVGKLFLSGRFKTLRTIAIGCYLISGVILLCYVIKPAFVVHGPLVRVFRVYMEFYPVTPIFFFLLFPTVILSFFLFHTLDARKRFTDSSPLVILGRVSLSIFFTHIVIFKELAIRFGYFNVFSSVMTPVAILMVMAIYTLLSVAWRNFRFRFGLEWVIRQVPLKD